MTLGGGARTSSVRSTDEQRNDEKPSSDPASPSEPCFPSELLTVPHGKQLDPAAARAANAGLTYIESELLSEAKEFLEADTAAHKADGKEIQRRHVDAVLRSDAEMRRLWAAWLIENPPISQTGTPPAQRPAATIPHSAFDDNIDRAMNLVYGGRNLSVSASARAVVAELLTHLVQQTMRTAAVIATRVNSDVIHAEDIRAACRALVPGELGPLTDREIRESMGPRPGQPGGPGVPGQVQSAAAPSS